MRTRFGIRLAGLVKLMTLDDLKFTLLRGSSHVQNMKNSRYVRFVGNLFLSISCEFHYHDIIIIIIVII